MNIEEFAEAALTEPDSWADFSDEKKAYVTHGRRFMTHRDADVLETSNWETIKADLMSRFPDDCFVLPSSHWAVGWVEELFVRVYDDNDQFTEAFKAMYDWHCTLESYPVADEQDLSEREHQDALETLQSSYSVPEDKAGEVLRHLWEYFDASRSEDFRDDQVFDAMLLAGIDREDIPSWLQRAEEPSERVYLSGAEAIKMGTLRPDGTVVNERVINANACPNLILVADHYLEDGSCKCHDESAVEMMTLGYRWKDGQWR